MAAANTHYPWYKKEDTDAFFALFQNNIANFVIIAITMLGMGFPTSIVYGQVQDLLAKRTVATSPHSLTASLPP